MLKKDLERENKNLKKQLEKRTFDNNHGELSEIDLAEIARLIQEGCSSGKLSDGEYKNLYWELNVNVWKD